MSMIFKNRSNGTLVPLVVEPRKAIENLTEGLHKLLGAVIPISKALHNLSGALAKGDAGPNEAIHVVHALSHSLMDLASLFVQASPIHAFDPKEANRWVHSETEEYLNTVLNPFLRQIQKDVDRENARDTAKDHGGSERDEIISELETMVGQKLALSQIADGYQSLGGLAQEARGLGTPGPANPAVPLVESPEPMPGEIKDVYKDKPRPTTNRPGRRKLRN